MSRATFILVTLSLVWLIVAQGCMKMRSLDSTIAKDNAKDSVKLSFHNYEIRKHQVHTVQSGVGDKPTLFFIHGSPGSWGAFSTYLKDHDLATKFQMVSVDRPGFGYSEFGHVLPFYEEAEILADLLKKFQNGHPIYVIGHSLGGPYTVQVAYLDSTIVTGIVLLAASVDPSQEQPEKWRKVFHQFPLRYLLPGAFRPSNDELLAFKEEVKQIPLALHQINCNVVIVQGLKDPLVPPQNAFFAQQQLARAKSIKMVTFDQANHFIPWTKFNEIKHELMLLPISGL